MCTLYLSGPYSYRNQQPSKNGTSSDIPSKWTRCHNVRPIKADACSDPDRALKRHPQKSRPRHHDFQTITIRQSFLVRYSRARDSTEGNTNTKANSYPSAHPCPRHRNLRLGFTSLAQRGNRLLSGEPPQHSGPRSLWSSRCNRFISVHLETRGPSSNRAWGALWQLLPVLRWKVQSM